MLRKMSVVLALALAVFATQGALATEVYQIDPTHSSVTFKIRHLVSNVTGRFDDFGGAITVDRDDMTKSSVEFTIQATSIDTDNENRDKHLRSPDFFDVEKFPTITFKSTKVEKSGDNAYNVTGDFTMHGTSKTITLPVSVLGFAPGMRGGTIAGFETSTTINRKEYGVVWNRALDAGGFLLGDDVQVNISLESNYKPAEPDAEKAGKK